MIDRMDIASKLNNLLSQKGLSQRDLARILGESKDRINRWFTGTQVPDVKSALRLARVFGVSVEYLADDAIDDPPTLSRTMEELALLELARETGVDQVFSPFTGQDVGDEEYERYLSRMHTRFHMKIAELYRRELEEVRSTGVATPTKVITETDAAGKRRTKGAS